MDTAQHRFPVGYVTGELALQFLCDAIETKIPIKMEAGTPDPREMERKPARIVFQPERSSERDRAGGFAGFARSHIQVKSQTGGPPIDAIPRQAGSPGSPPRDRRGPAKPGHQSVGI